VGPCGVGDDGRVMRARNRSIVTDRAPVLDDARELVLVQFARSAFAGVTIMLGLMGGIIAVYGTILVGIAHHFHLSVATAGVTLSANFAGALLGVAACWWALRHLPGGRVLASALVVFALGLGLASVAPSWPLFVASIAVGGVGFGALDVGVLTLISRTEEGPRAWRLSVTGSGWALGAIAGPLVIVLIRPSRFAAFLAGAGVLALLLAALMRGIAAPPVHESAAAASLAARPGNRSTVLRTFLAAFCCYVALETAIAGWVATQLHGLDFALAVGSLVTAGFWAGLAVGRLAARRLLRRWSGHWIVLVGLACAVGLLLVAGIRVLAPFAYPLVGVALASVFPLGLHRFTELSPDDHDGVASLVLVGMVGGILGSGAENVAVATFGVNAVPFVAAGLAALCLAVFASALRFGAHEPRSSATSSP
jgi:fucose permease